MRSGVETGNITHRRKASLSSDLVYSCITESYFFEEFVET